MKFIGFQKIKKLFSAHYKKKHEFKPFLLCRNRENSGDNIQKIELAQYNCFSIG
jgi:hypothetical protein